MAEGRLRLEDRVERWLPGLVRGNGNDGARVTVENLLRQTSGLNDYDEQLPWALDFTPERFRAERFRAWSPEDLVGLAMARPPRWLPRPDHPGAEDRWEYSNTNYVLAGMVVEAVTGHPLAQEVHDRIIEPLGLRHTVLAGTSAYAPQPRATGYTQFPGRPDLVDTTVFVPFPDAPIISTTADVITFLQALLSGRLLPAAQLARMRETVAAPTSARPAPGTGSASRGGRPTAAGTASGRTAARCRVTSPRPP